ncbi:hypothetical protein [Streptomyces sp. NPDC058603]|uniref:hypothetical protein n=1 Tax=Streptomyces sp. NPDC058603 TaxID=3346551 RepID=UPI00364A9AC5
MTTAPAPAADTPSPYVEVTPRYLAGPGEARYVIGPLRAVGWQNDSAPHTPVLRLITPDGRVRLAVDPDPDQWFWRIQAQANAVSSEAS